MGYWVTPGLQIAKKKNPVPLSSPYLHLHKIPFFLLEFLITGPCFKGTPDPLHRPSTHRLETKLVSSRITLLFPGVHLGTSSGSSFSTFQTDQYHS